MVIDHIGIVVKSLENGIEIWKNLFNYRQMTEPVINSKQKVKVVFLEQHDSTLIKLIEPIDQTSSIFLLARKGGGLHHLCFKSKDMDLDLQHLKENGAKILVPPEPGEAFESDKISFVYAKQGLNIELIDTDRKAKRLNQIDQLYPITQVLTCYITS